jgi:hypothetical protein
VSASKSLVAAPRVETSVYVKPRAQRHTKNRRSEIEIKHVKVKRSDFILIREHAVVHAQLGFSSNIKLTVYRLPVYFPPPHFHYFLYLVGLEVLRRGHAWTASPRPPYLSRAPPFVPAALYRSSTYSVFRSFYRQNRV